MIQHLRFAVIYSWHSFVRHKQRALFALGSIAAGVAIVTILRILGLSLSDALTFNAQAFLRSDILVAPGATPLRITPGNTDENRPLLLPDETRKLNEWAVQHEVEISYRYSGQLHQVSTVDRESPETSLAFGYFIDPQTYPFYDIIRADEPAGVLLKDLFTGSHPVVIARRLADDLSLHVGDYLQVGTAEAPFIITGIVPDSAENYLDNPFQIAFSFVYLEYDRLPEFGVEFGTADRAYVKLPPQIDPEVFVDTLYNDWRSLVPALVDLPVRYDRIGNILQRNRQISGFISESVLLFSLISLVIGGIGILNTMYVTVNRRAEEIAVLKTVGLQRHTIGFIFFVHALLLGIGGSLLGVVAGLILSLVARSIAEYSFNIPLPWSISADPIALGIGLGVGITSIFSLLPTFSATNVSPRLLLRQRDISLVRAGWRAILITGVVFVVGIGLAVDRILGIDSRDAFGVASLLIGMMITAAGLGMFLLLTLILWGIVWLLGHLPTFGNPHLLLAVRNLVLHRSRTASALLALLIGMSSLSATLILSRSISVLAFGMVSNPLGGNLLVVPLLPLTQSLVHTRLAETTGVTAYHDLIVAQAELVAIDGNPAFMDMLQPAEQVNENVYLSHLNLVTGIRSYGEPDTSQLLTGRLLSSEDAGQSNIVVPYHSVLLRLGVHLGSTFTYRMGDTTRAFTVVGFTRFNPQIGLTPFGIGNGVTAPLDMVSATSPFTVIIANVNPVAVPALTASLQRIPGVFAVSTGQFDTILNRVLRQTAALPLLIAILSLLAASVLMANTVSLATLERRQELGILKALGVKPRQLLWQLLLQNSIIGFVGGVISLALTFIATTYIPVVTDEIVELPLPFEFVIVLLTLSTSITAGATLLAGWSTVRQRPTTALHYE